MKVPFVKPAISQAEIQAASAAVASGWLSAGPRVKEFEGEFAKHLQVPKVLATSSCTSAVELVLRAIGTRVGDAVLMTPFSFVSVANVVANLGAVPVLVDVEPDTLNMDPAELDEVVDLVWSRYRLNPWAVIPTHMYGQACRMDEIVKIADRRSMFVLEDCAHAVGARGLDGRIVGSSQDPMRASVFSFYAIKNLACGEGGAICAAPGLLEQIEPMVLHGMTRGAWARYSEKASWRWDVEVPGLKANMTDPAAAIGLVQLKRLREMQLRRQQIAGLYGELLRPLDDAFHLELPPTQYGKADFDFHGWHLYVIQLPRGVHRQEVMDQLAELGVGTNVHFSPLYELTAYDMTGRVQIPRELEVARSVSNRILSLPIYPDLTDEQVEYVCDSLLKVLTKVGPR